MSLQELMNLLATLQEQYAIPGDSIVYINDSEQGVSKLQQVEFSSARGEPEMVLRIIMHSEVSE